MENLFDGIHKVRKLNRSGFKTYHYSWRGGPRIKSEPGTKEYVREHMRNLDGRDAVSKPRVTAQPGEVRNVDWLMDFYRSSKEFTALSDKTKKDYEAHISAIRRSLGRVMLSTMEKKGARSRISDWHNGVAAESGERYADYRLAVLRRALGIAVKRELLEKNPATEISNLHKGNRAAMIWSQEQIDAFCSTQPPHMVRALLFALLTGQRQKDLLEARYKQYRGGVLAFKQSKTDALARIDVTDQRLIDLLAGDHDPDQHILLTERGRPWKTGFPSAFRKCAHAAGVKDRTFHDLRGTFITDRYMRGDSFRKIGEASGHSDKSVEEIIRKHYLANNLTLRQEHDI